MQICSRCNGAIFYRSAMSVQSAVAYGRPMCTCQYSQVLNPNVPTQTTIGHYNASEIIERLDFLISNAMRSRE